MPLSAQAIESVKSILDGATSASSDKPPFIPGLVFVAVDKHGQTLVEHASGTKSIDSQDTVDLDTTFWIASCTKLIASIAVMQLVEQGKLSLDDPETIKKYAPEIGQKKVYLDGKNGVEQERPVTLRMLLAHTAGFAYAFLDPRVSMVSRPAGVDVFAGDERDVIEGPLFNQPGSAWEYGTNIDWAGIVLERATGMKLNDYMQKHIFEPLGIANANMFPNEEMRSNIAYMHQRDPNNGALKERDHIYRRAFQQKTKEEQDRFFHSAGAGLFAKPRDYVKILATLLNNGTCPYTSHRLLSPSTVSTMFENQIPQHPNFARNVPPPADPLLANHTPEMYPQGPEKPPQGWGLSFFLTLAPGATGRGANTAWWAGLANLYYWVDREKGVAGMIASQVLPFGDEKVVGTWVQAEKAVYDGLEK